MNTPIAICLDDLRLPIKTALPQAVKLGFRAVEISAVGGAVSPEQLSETGRRHFLKYISEQGLQLISLRAAAAGKGFLDPQAAQRRVDTMKKIMTLARQLGVPRVSTTPGILETRDQEIAAAELQQLQEIFSGIADDADRLGVQVALETAGMPAAMLHQLLSEINCPWLGAGCDTAAMIFQGDDPHQVHALLPGQLLLVRLRDATTGGSSGGGTETALGQGSLDIPRLLASIEEAGYDGPLVLTRTSGKNPIEDLKRGQEMLTYN